MERIAEKAAEKPAELPVTKKAKTEVAMIMVKLERRLVAPEEVPASLRKKKQREKRQKLQQCCNSRWESSGTDVQG